MQLDGNGIAVHTMQCMYPNCQWLSRFFPSFKTSKYKALRWHLRHLKRYRFDCLRHHPSLRFKVGKYLHKSHTNFANDVFLSSPSSENLINFQCLFIIQGSRNCPISNRNYNVICSHTQITLFKNYLKSLNLQDHKFTYRQKCRKNSEH